MSFLAWIDFDQADRDRTRRIMDLFDKEDSRDELGLGSVRDAPSDIMFPGTSTIQTRLRYMMFVPLVFRLTNRFNETVSRAKGLALVIGLPRLREFKCNSVELMRPVNTLCAQEETS